MQSPPKIPQGTRGSRRPAVEPCASSLGDPSGFQTLNGGHNVRVGYRVGNHCVFISSPSWGPSIHPSLSVAIERAGPGPPLPGRASWPRACKKEPSHAGHISFHDFFNALPSRPPPPRMPHTTKPCKLSQEESYGLVCERPRTGGRGCFSCIRFEENYHSIAFLSCPQGPS